MDNSILNDAKISRADLIMQLDECRAMACFLAESVSYIIEENSNYTEKGVVSWGASSCLNILADKLKQLSMRI